MARNKNKTAIAGIPIIWCCFAIALLLVGGITVGLIPNPLDGIPDDGADDGTNDGSDDDDTGDGDDDDHPGTPQYYMICAIQWDEDLPAEYKTALTFSIATLTGPVIDYRGFSAAQGDLPMEWFYGQYKVAINDATQLRLYVGGPDEFNFKSFTKVKYTNVGHWSTPFDIYYNAVAGEVKIGVFFLSWELVV